MSEVGFMPEAHPLPAECRCSALSAQHPCPKFATRSTMPSKLRSAVIPWSSTFGQLPTVFGNIAIGDLGHCSLQFPLGFNFYLGFVVDFCSTVFEQTTSANCSSGFSRINFGRYVSTTLAKIVNCNIELPNNMVFVYTNILIFIYFTIQVPLLSSVAAEAPTAVLPSLPSHRLHQS